MSNNSDTDLFRDTPVRYLGYANEIGEAFRRLISAKLVSLSYGISVSYVLADTVNKSWETKKKTNDEDKIVYAAVDTFTWQMLASVMIPGYTINRICWFTSKALEKMRLVKHRKEMLVTAVGLGCIPLIIKPIDHFTDSLLDNTLRKYRP